MSSSYPKAFTSFFFKEKNTQTVSAQQPTTNNPLPSPKKLVRQPPQLGWLFIFSTSNHNPPNPQIPLPKVSSAVFFKQGPRLGAGSTFNSSLRGLGHKSWLGWEPIICCNPPQKTMETFNVFVSDLERHGNVESFDKNIPFKGSTKKRFTINYLQFDLVGIPLTSLFQIPKRTQTSSQLAIIDAYPQFSS